MIEKRTTFWRRHRWLFWTGGGLLTFIAALTIAAAILAHRIEPFLRARIVEELSEHFHARVELDSFHVTLGNGLRGEWGVWAAGRGLRIWPPAEVAGVEVPNTPQTAGPLISLSEFRFHTPLHYQPGVPIYIGEVRLKGLDVHLPPRSHFLHLEKFATEGGEKSQQTAGGPVIKFQLGAVDCTNVDVLLGTSKPGKLPMELAFAHLRVVDIKPDTTMHFEAELTNPRPVGTIHTKGTFGPWQVSDPGESPVAGDYRFDHADLGTLKGIAGTLTSTGHYAGTLRDITVDGETDVPDFRLCHFDNAAALHTRFHARVDGTDGDTWLEPVDATIGHSHVIASGQIVRVLAPPSDGPPHSIGHDIALNVDVDRGRIEDFVRLASHDTASLITGNVVVKATLHIPPGPLAVKKRMAMNGRFALNQARFTSPKIQDRIEELSLRGQGKPSDVKTTSPNSIDSDMQGDFRMASGVITLPNLTFIVPGVNVEMNGNYALEGGELNFAGTAKMQATVSKMVGGWKGFLLKPADRFFKKDGAGTEVAIHIDGTRKDPHFGVDFKKKTSPERPNQQSRPQAPRQ